MDLFGFQGLVLAFILIKEAKQMTDAQQAICKNIHYYILFELTDNLETAVFAWTTMPDFGRYLFNLINRKIYTLLTL